MTEYFNPGAAKPPIGWQPQGALAGLLYSRDRQMYEQMMEMQKQKQREAMLRAQMENQTYAQDAPVRQAERAPKISGAQLQDIVNRASQGIPGYGETMGRGKMGEAQTAQARGQFDIGTNPGRIANTNLEQTINATGMRAQQQRMNQAPTPYQVLEEQSQTPQSRAAERLEGVKTQGNLQVTNAQGQNQMAVQRLIQQGQNARAQMSKEAKAQVDKLEELMVAITLKETQGKATPQEIQARDQAFKALQTLYMSRGMGAYAPYQFMAQPPGAGAVTPPQPQPYPGSQPPAQAPGQYVIGQKYQFKQGNYEYRGGDPKVQASWRKVD